MTLAGSDLQEIVISGSEIRTAQGNVQTAAELVELLQAHQITKVKLRLLDDAGYEVIGKVIYGLTRVGIDIELAERPVDSGVHITSLGP